MSETRLHWSTVLSGLPAWRFAQLPTPLTGAAHLGRAVGAPHLLTKRDDRSAALYGGNKVRKLEFLLGDARARGCDAVLTFGAAGSNHALATALHARTAGLEAYAVLTDQIPTPYVADTLRWHVRNGTKLVAAQGYAGADAAARRLCAEHPSGPERVAQIPWGGSSTCGTLGFVQAGLEIAEQLTQAGIGGPVRLYLPCGTLGSVAGLLLGLALAGSRARVVAVKVVPRPHINAAAALALATATSSAFLEGFPLSPPAVPGEALEFHEEQLGAGYAHPTPAGVEASRLAAELEGFKVDTTYSAKALAALIADARAGLLNDCTPVFWQTYNSQPLPPGLADIDGTGLPEALRKFLPKT